ncbi:hypothetical protein HF086_018103, partial [Spodoptera exigua]
MATSMQCDPNFQILEARAKDLTNCEEYQQQTSRRIKRNTKYDHFSSSNTLDDYVENQTPGQRFEFEFFVVNTDRCDAHMNELPVPCLPWEPWYSDKQSLYNKILLGGIL